MSDHEDLPEVRATPETQLDSAPKAGIERRSFLASAGGIAAIGAGSTLLSGLTGQNTASASQPISPLNEHDRAIGAYRVRVICARRNFEAGLVAHPNNGDETAYPQRLGSFTKGLPHNNFGEVDQSAYYIYLDALDRRTQAAFEFVPAGQPNSQQRIRFTNPLGGLAFDLQGVDAQNTTVRAAPAFASAEIAGEIVENYWMALLRDVPFSQYATSPLAAQACTDLSALNDFRGPKVGGVVTPQTLFRDQAPGCTTGPFLSQFWWKSQPFGAQFIDPKIRTATPGVNYMTTEPTWLAVQNGVKPATLPTYDPTLRYMRNGRDLGQWVHIDVLFQAYFQALLHMMTPPDALNPFTGGGMGCPPNPGNPYLLSLMQDGFTTFGGPHFATLTCEVSTRALKATWFQKWYVHRHLRPEAFAGRVHHKVVNGRQYPIHGDVLNSQALAMIQSQNGGACFLPQAFPEGSPAHPAYTAGHATVAGACVTIIKALFYTDGPFPNPVVPTDDGLGLVPYVGPILTVGGELNKLAMNVAYGRNIAGVHWRSDGYESMRLGEEIAISLLREQADTYCEDFQGLTFKKFDGSTITV